mmetsp:Transcript_22780/g.91262  ORF Transcript_22780/g.91262 Transcript_22780/m.91262 type:complete len:96 (-) Transcript_22780:438-725(-)
MSVRITYVNGGMKNVPMLSKVQHLELDVAHTSLYLEDAAKLMPQRPAPAPSSITVSLAIDESPNELRSCRAKDMDKADLRFWETTPAMDKRTNLR